MLPLQWLSYSDARQAGRTLFSVRGADVSIKPGA